MGSCTSHCLGPDRSKPISVLTNDQQINADGSVQYRTRNIVCSEVLLIEHEVDMYILHCTIIIGRIISFVVVALFGYISFQISFSRMVM